MVTALTFTEAFVNPNASAADVLTVAPELIVNAPRIVPVPPPMANPKVPPLTVVPPVYVSWAERRRVPLPFLVKALADPMTPLIVSVPAAIVIVGFAAPRVTAPVPRSRSCEPSAAPKKVKSPLIFVGWLPASTIGPPLVLPIDPPEIVNRADPIEFASLRLSVPPLIVTGPVPNDEKELALSVPPLTLTAPLTVTGRRPAIAPPPIV